MKEKGNRLKNIIKEHIINNKKEYLLVMIIFIMGVILGVFCVNNIQNEKIIEIKEYINKFIESIKTIKDLKQIELLKNSVSQNITLALTVWFFGTTVIRNTNSIRNNTI